MFEAGERDYWLFYSCHPGHEDRHGDHLGGSSSKGLERSQNGGKLHAGTCHPRPRHGTQQGTLSIVPALLPRPCTSQSAVPGPACVVFFGKLVGNVGSWPRPDLETQKTPGMTQGLSFIASSGRDLKFPRLEPQPYPSVPVHILDLPGK